MSELKADAVEVLKAGFTGFVSYIVPIALFRLVCLVMIVPMLSLTLMVVTRGGKLSESVFRSATAFAVFTGSYRGLRGVIRELTHAKGPNILPVQYANVVDRWSSFIAGGLAGLLGNAIDSSWSGSIFVIWLFIRAIRLHLPSHEELPWYAACIFLSLSLSLKILLGLHLPL
jgi:hypothetical protein